MPFSTSSLVPHFDVTVHIVLDDFGKAGRAYRESDEAQSSFETVVDDFLTGQYSNPVRVVAFNTSEGWSRDVSEDVAREVLRRVAERGRPLAASSRQFVGAYVDEDELSRASSERARRFMTRSVTLPPDEDRRCVDRITLLNATP